MFSRRFFQTIAVLAAFGLPACSGGAASNQVPGPGSAAAGAAKSAQRSPAAARAFAASCVTGALADGCTNVEVAGTTIYGPATPAQQVPGLHPADLQAAYQLPSATAGNGQTIAIIIAKSDPNAESDLAVYRSTFGLPPCSSASGCFRVAGNNIGSTGDPVWAREASIDLDMASAVCPKCKLLLYQAADTKDGNLATAVSGAVSAGATVVSNSYAVAEVSSENNAMWSHPGVPIVAAAGDQGYGAAKWPAASTNVIAVGATTLVRNAATARGWSETAWSFTGSGCSAIAAKPVWQTDTGCAKRTIADVAAVGDPATPVAVYDSYQDNGWVEMGGTSVATPIVAGVYALAGNAAQLKLNGASSLYANRSALFPVGAGSNGLCTLIYLCTADLGYSGPAGLGSPRGITAF